MNQPILSPLAKYSERGRAASIERRPGAARFLQESKPTLLEHARVVWAQKWVILAIALAVAIPAAIYAFKVPPTYRASTLLLIEQNKDRVVSFQEAVGAGLGNREYLLTQVEFLQSRNVLERVIDKLGLLSHPLYDPLARVPGLVSLVKAKIAGLFRDSDPKPPTSDDLRTEVHDELFRNLSVEPVRLSQLISVSFDSRDPEMAARIANAVAEAYIQAEMDARYSMTVQANIWLNEQAQKLRANLAASERALQAYREEKGLIDKQTEAQGGAGRQLEALTQRLVEARVRRTQAAQVLAQVRSVRGRALESVPAVMADPNVTRAREVRARAQLKVAELSERYGQAHPLFQTAQAELEASEVAVAQAVDAVVAGIGKEYAAAKAVEDGLASAVEKFQKTIQAQNRDEFELANYEREVTTNRMLLETFLSRAKETNLAADIRTASARVVDKAVPPADPIKPQKAQIIGLALVFGGILGTVLVLARHRLDQSIDSVETAESKLGQSVLAALPKLPSKKQGIAYKLLEAEPESHFSEGVRTIRSSILLSDIGGTRKVIMVTSSVAGEGKSTISFNLALALSQTMRTVFVECDLRRPSLRQRGMSATQSGVYEVLAGRASLGTSLITATGTNLTVLCAGKVPRNPLEMLSTPRFQAMIGQLAEEFDAVVVDTPPVAVVSDALMMAPLASSVVLVVQAGRTSRKVVRRSLSLLAEATPNVLGIVLNGLDFRKAESYYGEYSGEYSSDYFTAYKPDSEEGGERTRSRGERTAAVSGS